MNIGDVALSDESFTIGDINWRVGRAGSGPPVFLVHGFPDTPYTFKQQLGPLLEAGFEVIVPFLPGYHPSTIAGAKYYCAGNLGRDFASLIQTMGYQQVHFIGHDWGGIAGYQLAAQYRERVSRLVSVAVPQARGLAGADMAQLWRSRYMLQFQLPGSDAWARRGHFAKIDSLYHEWSPGWRDNHKHIDTAKRCLETGKTLSTALGYYRTMFRQSLLDGELRKNMSLDIPVPTLAVAGRDDGCIGLGCMEAQAKGFESDYRLVILDNAGHFCHAEQADAFNAAVIEFLS